MHDGPVAIVTGAGSGIGRRVAVRLAAAGYALVLVARTESALRESAALTGAPAERIELFPGDVGEAAVCRGMVARAVERFGRLEALVNNAGVAPLAPIDRSSPEMIERTFRVNALAPAWAIAAAWPIFAHQHAARAARGATARAAVVNVSTLGTLDPFAGFFAYASAKAAVNLMAVSVAGEGRDIGVRGFAVAPGAVETPMLRANFPPAKVPASSCLDPDEVARVIVDCVTGARDADNGRVIAVVPRGMAAWLAAWRDAHPGGHLAPGR